MGHAGKPTFSARLKAVAKLVFDKKTEKRVYPHLSDRSIMGLTSNWAAEPEENW
jgi:hypothetical protein